MLTARQRTNKANRQLGCLLAFVAGAINVGGFLAVQRYTSHMTGVVSAIANDLVLGRAGLVLAGSPLKADRDRLVKLAAFLGRFLAGGIGGAAAFKAIGDAAVLPIVAVLVAISALHLVADSKLLLKLSAAQ